MRNDLNSSLCNSLRRESEQNSFFVSVSVGALNITECNVCCHPTALLLSSLLFYICAWLTLIVCLSSQSRRPPLKRAQAWIFFFLFFIGHLNFYTSIYPPFNLPYNDAIRTESIWKFCWERLMFRGFLLLMPLCLHWQQMLWKQQIHSPQSLQSRPCPG